MAVTSHAVETLIQRVREIHPDWEGFDHPGFVEEERRHKEEACELARSTLDRSALEGLVERQAYSEIIDRLKKVAQATGLLYLSQPRTGDLAVLHQRELDREAFARELIELLHGDLPSPQRIDRFTSWCEAENLPTKWTFTTYYLFLLRPEQELFVKPESVRKLLKLLDSDIKLKARPSGAVYGDLTELMEELKGGLTEAVEGEPPRDMLDLYSLVWLSGNVEKHQATVPDAGREIDTVRQLLHEFQDAYLGTERGRWHTRAYDPMREEGRQNYKEIIERWERGEDVTDEALLKLLPHRDTDHNRKVGAWVHVAPAIHRDVKEWFEGAGWVDPNDWPRVVEEFLRFIQAVVEDPDRLDEAGREFSESPYSRGFQTGMVTPILNALAPDHFLLINNKSRALINYVHGTRYSGKLEDYPELNRDGFLLVSRLQDELAAVLPEGVRPEDGLDMFVHWLVAIKRFRFGRERAWAVRMDDPTTIRRMQEDGAVALEAPEGEGEITEETVGTFKDRVNPADRVLVFDPSGHVHGIALVAGPYEHRSDEALPHRVPVEWEDDQVRRMSEPGWTHPIQEIDPQRLEAIRKLPPQARDEAEGPFTRRTFELLEEIHRSPTRAFYQERKEQFEEHVEEPLQRLFHAVAPLLPQPMRDALETEKRLFSRFPKNDFGRGGAWDFYWGAFYPKGERRIASPQLFCWMNREVFGCGFAVGDYDSGFRDQLVANLRRHRQRLRDIFSNHLTVEGLRFGAEADQLPGEGEPTGVESARAWLDAAGGDVLQVRRTFTADEVVGMSQQELEDAVRLTFEELYPLMLLAMLEDPMPAIAEFLGEAEEESEEEVRGPYPLETLGEKTRMPSERLKAWRDAIERKGQAIFFGPPGTGKTFVAEHMAEHLAAGGDGVVELVQFHPAYAYEDFMKGIRPHTREDGSLDYRMTPGRFLEFCRRASSRQGTSVLIIDEINRANLSRVFGELMYLLEYRNESVSLAGGDAFQVPEQVRILGTMNTADRSIALVDHALRRRFAFFRLEPDWDLLQSYHEEQGRTVDGLLKVLRHVNQEISDPDYHVGITFFLEDELEDRLETIWRTEIEPYLEEQFVGNRGRMEQFRWERIESEVP